jgi:hypothetical protein
MHPNAGASVTVSTTKDGTVLGRHGGVTRDARI